MQLLSILVTNALLAAAVAADASQGVGLSISCPSPLTLVDTFTLSDGVWGACEDLTIPGGDLVLLPPAGSSSTEARHFPKSYEPYWQSANDEDYYLGLGKQKVLDAKWDMLGGGLELGQQSVGEGGGGGGESLLLLLDADSNRNVPLSTPQTQSSRARARRLASLASRRAASRRGRRSRAQFHRCATAVETRRAKPNAVCTLPGAGFVPLSALVLPLWTRPLAITPMTALTTAFPECRAT